MKNIILLSLYLFYTVACTQKREVEWVASTPESLWKLQISDSVEFLKTGEFDTEIEVQNPLQTIDGFGSCFNELGWTSLSLLSETDREFIMNELFAPGVGANFTICRMPVAANDFSRNWYSYNETENDFEMENFSIANDRETLVPFIKNALKYNPNLKIWASPWCPPAWMKYNKHYACSASAPSSAAEYRNDIKPEQQGKEGTDMFIQEDAYFKAYALYFAKFIEAYRNENINISMVMPQNEFNSCQPFPSCTWTAAGLNRFTGTYLGPKMQELGVELMFGTMERSNHKLVDTLLQDPESRKYIKGVGFQWAGKESVGKIHSDYPALKLYQTEQECGNGKNDWRYCRYAWSLMKHYLNNGVNVYDYWNTSLEEGGMSRWGWTQNSLITVNGQDKTYKFTYEYYLLKHVSHYVLSGAVFLPVSGSYNNLLAFRNVDGSYVLILNNEKDTVIKPVIKVGDKMISMSLPPDSFNTIVIK
jgi:glucosylceramidase